jgi:hypothetical protein
MANPTCAIDCNVILPVVKFDDCAPKYLQSQIKRVFIAKGNAASFTDVSLVAEWTTRLSETTTGADVIRPLSVSGSMPAPSVTEYATNRRNSIVINREHTINFTIDDCSDENYEFMLSLQCGGTYKLWFETWGKKLYGGNTGRKVTIQASPVLGGGDGDVTKIECLAKWKSVFSLEKPVLSPIYSDEN